MTVTARMRDGSEASLTRTLQTVAIPVFQFGIYSENDLSFFAGPNFNFGGRVHTNHNVFLAEGPGATLTLADRVTAVGEIIRTTLANGNPSATNHSGTVSAITAPNSFRSLAMAEGSLTGGLGTAQNEPTWTNLSTGTYNHNIMNGRTGRQAARPADHELRQFADRADSASGGEREHQPTRTCSPSASTRSRACAFCCRTRPPTSHRCRA